EEPAVLPRGALREEAEGGEHARPRLRARDPAARRAYAEGREAEARGGARSDVVAGVAGRVRLAARARAVEDEARPRVRVVYEILERAAREVFEEGFVVARQGEPRAAHTGRVAALRARGDLRAQHDGEKDEDGGASH